MDVDTEKAALTKRYEDLYMAGFHQNDVSLINQIIDYPLIHLRDGNVTRHESFPIEPARLKAEKDWDHSGDWNFDVPAINDHQAHAVASVKRYRADGSLIEHVHALYDFKKINGVWKIYAIAEINY